MEQNQNPQPPEFDQPQYPQPQYPQAEPKMPFWTAVKTCFKKYCDFKGRARRSEYWWFMLFQLIIGIVWSFLCALMLSANGESLASNDVSTFFTMLKLTGLMILPVLIFIIPNWAVQTRRLHDTGRSGWWIVASVALSLIYTIFYYWMMYQMIKNFDSGEYASLPMAMLIISAILGLAVLVMGIIILVFTVQDSQIEENKYGPSPKYQ